MCERRPAAFGAPHDEDQRHERQRHDACQPEPVDVRRYAGGWLGDSSDSRRMVYRSPLGDGIED
jgi:hypothetical protein